eukprot:TRINITY_DN76_c0_g1_i4.p1 TRINITY_DN76_c0_g1~~TRINITY_DN76_c0_g1_i4.p1  ORF type:complete len:480 (+),score=197.47 TRINITY_DN76_c0_g1_i4:1154-2593(+)
MFGLEESGVKNKLYAMFSEWANKMVKNDPSFVVPNISKPHVHTARKKTKSMIENEDHDHKQTHSLKKRRKRDSSADSMDTEPAAASDQQQFDVPQEFQFEVNPTRFFRMAARGRKTETTTHQQMPQQLNQQLQHAEPSSTRAGSKRSHDMMMTNESDASSVHIHTQESDDTSSSSSAAKDGNKESGEVEQNNNNNNTATTRRRSSRVAKRKRSRNSSPASQMEDDSSSTTTNSTQASSTSPSTTLSSSSLIQENEDRAAKRRRLDQQRDSVDRAMKRGNDPSNVMQLSAMLESMSPSLHYRKQQMHSHRQNPVAATPSSSPITQSPSAKTAWERFLASEDSVEDVDDSATDLFRYDDDDEEADLLTFDMFDNHFSLESNKTEEPVSMHIRSESPLSIRGQLHQLNTIKKRQYQDYVHCMNRMGEIVMLAKNARDVDSNMPFVAAQMAQYANSLMEMAKVNQSVNGRIKQLERERMLNQL